MIIKKIQGSLTRQIAVIVAFFFAFNITVDDAYAHTPHDMVRGLGVSPDFVNDRTLYAATDGALTGWRYPALLRSTNSGDTWTHLPNGMDHVFQFGDIRVSPIFSSDHTVFAATLGAGVYQSSDRGDSWQPFNTGLASENLKIAALNVAGTDANYMLFLVDSNRHLFRRSNIETDWTRMQGSNSIAVFAASPDFTRDTTVMTADGSGNLRRSINGGVDWVDLGNPTAAVVHDIAIAPGDAKEIFLATSNHGIFHSDDSGNTFVNKLNGLPAEAINNVAVSPNYLIDRTVFCTSITQAVYKSTDAGETWTLYQSGVKLTKQTSELNEFSELQVSNTFSTDQTVFLSAFDGLFLSNDGGSTWIEKQTRLNLLTGLALSPDFMEDHKVVVSTYAGGGIYTSADKGATWSLGSTDWPMTSNELLSVFDVDFMKNRADSPLTLVATRNFSYWGFSKDFGESWDMLSIPIIPGRDLRPTFVTLFALSPNFDIDQEIYLGTRRSGIIQTVDGGVSWRSMQGVPNTSNITSLAVSPNYTNDRTVFAANNAGEVWRTTDGGDNWSQVGAESIISRGRSTRRYTWVAISPDFATDQLVLVGTDNGVYRSSTGGDVWSPFTNLKIGQANAIQQIEFSPNFSNDRIAYVMVRGKGLYRIFLHDAGWLRLGPQNVGKWLLERNIQFTEFKISPSFAQDTTIMGAARERVYISKDGGFTWAVAGYPGEL